MPYWAISFINKHIICIVCNLIIINMFSKGAFIVGNSCMSMYVFHRIQGGDGTIIFIFMQFLYWGNGQKID